MVQGSMTATRLEESKELAKDMKKVIVFSFQKQMEIPVFIFSIFFCLKTTIFF